MTSQQGYDTYDTPGEPIMNNRQYLTNSNASSNCSQNKIPLVDNDESSYLMRMNNKFGVVLQTEKNNMQSVFTALLGLKNYAMFICLLVDDDTKDSFNKLNITLKSIYNDIEGLNKFGFTYENILVCCFIKCIETNTFMFNNKLIIDSLTSPDNRILSCWRYVYEKPNNAQVQVQMQVTEQENQLNNNINNNNNNNNSSDTPHLSILFTTASKYLTFTFPNAITFMHNQIIPSLTNQKIIYITTITNGISTSETTFPQLLCSLSKNIQNVNNNTNNTQNPNLISVASIEHAPITVNQSIWDKISQFELIYYNNYDLNYYDLSCGVPVDHRCNIMQLDSNGRNIIKNIYKAIPSNASIEYCDYAVSIEAVHNHIEVQYCHNVNAYINDIGSISYVDYMQRFITKHGGDYACLLNLMENLFTNSNKQCKILSKVICVLQLIGIMFEMIQPSLTCMVTYSVFAEGFNTFNMQPAVFLTSFLGMLFALSGVIALITKQQHSQTKSNIHFILFIVYEVYYVFIIIVAMCAMYFIKHKKPTISESDLNSNAAYENYNDYLNILSYDFNTAAVVSIILINIIIGVMPMLIQFKKFFAENIVNALLYLVFGSISANSHFLVSYLHKFGEYRGYSDHMKSVYVVVFYLMNCFVGYLTMTNTCRRERVDAVLTLSIIFTCYNSLKCLAIVFKKLYIDKKVVDVIAGNNAVEKVKNVVDGVNDLCLDNTKEDRVAINNQSLEENNNINDKDGIEGGEQVQTVDNVLGHENQSTHIMDTCVQDNEEINNNNNSNHEEIEENVSVKDNTIKAVENGLNNV